MVVFAMTHLSRIRALQCGRRSAIRRALALGGLLLVAGCRGRAEFQRAETYFQSGAYRQAYLSYWEAYQLHPSEDFLLALRKAGRRVAEDEQAKARRAEAQGRMDEALDGYELALEYDASSPATLDSYHRLSDRREAIAALRGIDRAGEGQGEAASDWEPARRTEELVRQESGTSDLERNLREAIAAASGARLSRLREVTLEQPLSSDKEDLARLSAAWNEAIAEIEAHLAREEDGLFSDDSSERELASWGAYRTALLGPLCEARAALSNVDLAASGLRDYEIGSTLEAAGRLPEAAEAYLRSTFEHPYFGAPRSARARVVKKITDDARDAALLALRRQDWKAATGHFDQLLTFDPSNEEARNLRTSALDEVAKRHFGEGMRLEDSGLPGCALIEYYQALDAADELPAARSAIDRVESVLFARAKPTLRVKLRSASAEQRQASRDLWAVDEEAVLRFEKAVVEGAGQELAKEEGVSPPGPPRPELEILIEDLDYCFTIEALAHGSEVAWRVESFQLVPHPFVPTAAAAVRSSEDAVLAARQREAEAPPHRKDMERELVSLRAAELSQASALLASLPAMTPRLVWSTTSVSTRELRSRAEAAARCRVDGEAAWITVSDECENIPAPEVGRGAPASDAAGVLPRSEALRILGPRLGQAVARHVQGRLRTRAERLYREGIERLEARSFDVATESLVTFLYLRRGSWDALTREASRRLQAVTGCDLPGLWKKHSGDLRARAER